MAEYGSDHYVKVNQTTGVSVELLRTQRASSLYLAPTVASGVAMELKRAQIVLPNPTDLADDEVLAMMDFKSGDRIWEIWAYNNAGFTATGTANIGLYEAGELSVGTVIDEDLYALDLVIGGALVRVDVFEEATTLTEFHRGLTLWEQAAIGAASYTVDPYIDMTLAYTMSSEEAATAAVAIAVLEVWYTPAR